MAVKENYLLSQIDARALACGHHPVCVLIAQTVGLRVADVLVAGPVGWHIGRGYYGTNSVCYKSMLPRGDGCLLRWVALVAATRKAVDLHFSSSPVAYVYCVHVQGMETCQLTKS